MFLFSIDIQKIYIPFLSCHVNWTMDFNVNERSSDRYKQSKIIIEIWM